jgi:multimeric flavodoxin WrbA
LQEDFMKVLLVNGSPKQNGSTATALKEISLVLEKEGIETEIFNIGTPVTRDCIGCGACRKNGGKCAFDDDCVNLLIEKAKGCDGFVFGTPVYYAHPSGMLLSVLNRTFYAGGSAFAHKPAATIACARRAGTTCSLDVLNKYVTISQMPLVSSSYWNGIYGRKADEVLLDEEGRQTLENLARNMAWLIKCISEGKKNGVSIPENPKVKRTNFIR